MRPKRVAFYGNFGDGNLGNEVTLQTAIEHTLKRWPDAQLLCICTGPEDVRARHGIEAVCSRAKRQLWSRRARSAESAADRGGSASGPSGSQGRLEVASGWRRLIASQRAKSTRSFRLAALAARALRWGFYSLPLEVTHWVRGLRAMAGSDTLIVPGTGILTDNRCSPWVWPYELFKYCALARLCRVQVVFLSVGAGPIHHPLSRWLITRSLALARYRSYRDEDSKRCIEGLGFDARRDVVCPDLVFGLSSHSLPPSGPAEARRKVVGLGLKDYAGREGNTGYRAYLEAMAAFVLWLGQRGYTVRLLIGDEQYDTRVRRELLELLASRTAARDPPPRILADPVPTVRELIRQLAETDVVISPRLHNLILALILGKPVIALCDLRKVEALLGDFELAEYCLQIEGLDDERLATCFVHLESEAARVQTHIRGRVDSYQRAVEQQYAEVFDADGT